MADNDDVREYLKNLRTRKLKPGVAFVDYMPDESTGITPIGEVIDMNINNRNYSWLRVGSNITSLKSVVRRYETIGAFKIVEMPIDVLGSIEFPIYVNSSNDDFTSLNITAVTKETALNIFNEENRIYIEPLRVEHDVTTMRSKFIYRHRANLELVQVYQLDKVFEALSFVKGKLSIEPTLDAYVIDGDVEIELLDLKVDR